MEANEFLSKNTNEKFLSATCRVHIPGNFTQTAPGNLHVQEKCLCYLQGIALAHGTSSFPRLEPTGSCRFTRSSNMHTTNGQNYIATSSAVTSLSTSPLLSTKSTFASSVGSLSAFASTAESTSVFTGSATEFSTFSSTSSSFSSSNSFPTVNTGQDSTTTRSISKAIIFSERSPTSQKQSTNLSKTPKNDDVEMNQNCLLASIATRCLKRNTISSICTEAEEDANNGCQLETRNRSASEGDAVESIPRRRMSPIGAEDPKTNTTQSFVLSRKIKKDCGHKKRRNLALKSKRYAHNSSGYKKGSVRKLSSSGRNRADSDTDSENAWVTGDSAIGSDTESEENLPSPARLENKLIKCRSDTALNVIQSDAVTKSEPISTEISSRKKFLLTQASVDNEISSENFEKQSDIGEKIRDSESVRPMKIVECPIESQFFENASVKCGVERVSVHSSEELKVKKCLTKERKASNSSLSVNCSNPQAKKAITKKSFTKQELTEKSELCNLRQQKCTAVSTFHSHSQTPSELNDQKSIYETHKHSTMDPSCVKSNQTTADVHSKFTAPRSATSVRDLIKKFSSMDNLTFTDNAATPRPFRKENQPKSTLQGGRYYKLRKASLDPERIGEQKTIAVKSVSCDSKQEIINDIRGGTRTYQTDIPIYESSWSLTDFNSQALREKEVCMLAASKLGENTESETHTHKSEKENSRVHTDVPVVDEGKNLSTVLESDVNPESFEILHRSQMSDPSNKPAMSISIREEESSRNNADGLVSRDSPIIKKHELQNDYLTCNFLTHVKKSPFQKFKESLFGSNSHLTEGVQAKNISERSGCTEPNISSTNSDHEIDECSVSSRRHTYVQLKSLKTWKDFKRLSFKRRSNASVAPSEEATNELGDLSLQERTASSLPSEIYSGHGSVANSFSFDACQALGPEINEEQTFFPSAFRTSQRRYSVNSTVDKRQPISRYFQDVRWRSNFDSRIRQSTAKPSLIAQFTRSKAQEPTEPDKTAAKYYNVIYRNLLTGKKSWSPRSNVRTLEEEYSFRRHSLSTVSPEVSVLREKRLTPSSFYPLTLSPISPKTENSFYGISKESLHTSVDHGSTAPQSFHRTWAQESTSSSARATNSPYFSTRVTFPNQTINLEYASERGSEKKNFSLLYPSK